MRAGAAYQPYVQAGGCTYEPWRDTFGHSRARRESRDAKPGREPCLGPNLRSHIRPRCRVGPYRKQAMSSCVLARLEASSPRCKPRIARWPNINSASRMLMLAVGEMKS